MSGGYFLMINNRSSEFSYVAKQFMGQDFSFRIKEKVNLSEREVLEVLKNTARRDFSSDYCFLCVILNRESKDETKAITSLFSRDKCPSLDGKPNGMECKQSRNETVVHLHEIFWVKMIF